MDNATKAILIAGGILLALLTLSVMVAMFGSMQQMEEAKDKKEVIAEMNEWNAEWEAYNKKVMYGSDVLTVVNKAAEVNHKFGKDSPYTVTIIVNGIDINTELESNKLSIFRCEGIHYNEKTGYVDSMTFKFIRK